MATMVIRQSTEEKSGSGESGYQKRDFCNDDFCRFIQKNQHT